MHASGRGPGLWLQEAAGAAVMGWQAGAAPDPSCIGHS